MTNTFVIWFKIHDISIKPKPTILNYLKLEVMQFKVASFRLLEIRNQVSHLWSRRWCMYIRCSVCVPFIPIDFMSLLPSQTLPMNTLNSEVDDLDIPICFFFFFWMPDHEVSHVELVFLYFYEGKCFLILPQYLQEEWISCLSVITHSKLLLIHLKVIESLLVHVNQRILNEIIDCIIESAMKSKWT